jgi:drug/metabolite transporter (DMT)-like permease
MLIIKPTFANLNLTPSLIGFLGGVCAGASMTALRYLGKKRVSPPLIVFSFSLLSTLVTLPYLIVVHHPMELRQIGLLVCAGLAATGGQFSVTAAYRCAPAREISVFTYSQVLTSALLGFFLFDQVPDWFSFIGYLIVCAMAAALFFYNRRRNLSDGAPCPADSDDLGL